jgi:pre-mRNA-processing factor 17
VIAVCPAILPHITARKFDDQTNSGHITREITAETRRGGAKLFNLVLKMADFGDYPPNMARPQNALIVRAEGGAEEHAVTKYTAENLSRPNYGPANPFRDEKSQLAGAKRKGAVPAGTAQEIALSEYTFRSKVRAVERAGGPERETMTAKQIREESKKIRAGRETKGSATIAEGDGAYVGPWAKYKAEEEYEEEELGSDEEYEVVEETEEEEEEVVESGTVIKAPAPALAKRKEIEEMGNETTAFHGSELLDYQGRSYMHVPQDLDVDLRKEVGGVTNFIPKKLLHSWKSPSGKAVTSLRLFPRSGHLLLSGGADNTVRIWDVYHERELLRSFDGHSKAITDLSFNTAGTNFVSASFDRHMKVWDTETGQIVSRHSTGKTPHCVTYNPTSEHGHTFLAGMSDANILCFDTRAGNEPVQEYNHHLAAVNTITFVEDGDTFMSTSDDKSIRCWNWDVPVPIKYIAETWMFPLTRAALHPSGKSVAYQSGDNQVLVYAASDKFRQNRKKSFRGHNSAGLAVGVDISPDGQFLASGDSSGNVCFWSWKSCQMYHTLRADPTGGAVTCVLWHPQETSKMVTAGQAGDIKLWD